MTSQIGCCFTINDEEWIYNGKVKPEAGFGYECNKCYKEDHKVLHQFIKEDEKGNIKELYYGSTCVKSVIQAGFVRY